MVFTILRGCLHTQMIETYLNTKACVVRMVHTMITTIGEFRLCMLETKMKALKCPKDPW